MSGNIPESERGRRRWALAGGFCAVVLVSALIIALPRHRYDLYPPYPHHEIRVCEPRVRRLTVAYLPSAEDGFSYSERQAVRNEISKSLAPIRARVNVVDKGEAPKLDCNTFLPKSPDEMTLVLFEKHSEVLLATIHFRSNSEICRSGNLDVNTLKTVLLRRNYRGQTITVNDYESQAWKMNLPKVVNSKCSNRQWLPGANNVAPSNMEYTMPPRADNQVG